MVERECPAEKSRVMGRPGTIVLTKIPIIRGSSPNRVSTRIATNSAQSRALQKSRKKTERHWAECLPHLRRKLLIRGGGASGFACVADPRRLLPRALEVQPESELHLPRRIRRTVDSAEGRRRGQGERGIRQRHMVHHVRELEAEVAAHALGEAHGLADRQL